MATDYSVNTTFRSDIKSETSCFAAATPYVKGACVFEKTKDCTLTTKEKCLSTGGKFNKGLLCTATQLGTNCAKTDNTQCKDGKVYFLDSCGNLANVYDASMFKKNKNAWTAGMEDYWRNIQDPTCTAKDNYANCGTSGSICKVYNRNNNETQKPTYGNNVCADLSCNYQGQKYEQGESWCASSGGAYNKITVDPNTGKFTKASLSALAKINQYNLPGSRYYKLTCMDGEVLIDPCSDYRNEFCVQSTYENSSFKIAQCRTNDWRNCNNLTTQSSCEAPSLDCKWVPGYRYDGKVLTKKGDSNIEEQGSCVPLVAPGFDFWKKGNSGSVICRAGNVLDSVIYETGWLKNRNKFANESTKKAAESCLENCYLIPGYGSDLGITGMETLWSGTSVGNLANHFISLRKGHYCGNSKYSKLLSGGKANACGGKANALGKVSGDKIKCASTRARTLPIFFTNSQWLNSIRNRERSLGDCGYKSNILGEKGTPNSEI